MANKDIRDNVIDLLKHARPKHPGKASGPVNITIEIKPTITCPAVMANLHRINFITHISSNHISDSQAVALERLVEQIAFMERRARSLPLSIRDIWVILNRKMAVTTHRSIPNTRFKEAKEFLEEWVRLLSLLLEPLRDEKDWYIRRYSFLINHIGRLGLRLRFSELLQTDYGVEYMADLSAEDLMSAYRTASEWIYKEWLKI
jgi:hypothetical protein